VVKSSGSGAPYFCKKAELKDVCFEIVRSVKEQRFDEQVFRMPNVIYQVIQASKSGKYKRRIVYCPPFAVTVLELIFGLNVQKHFVSNENTSIVMGHKQEFLYNLNIKFKDYNKVSGDYSSYDQTLPSLWIKVSFEIIKDLYNFNNEYESLLYDKMVSYVMHGHIYHPKCGTIRRKRGIASGSVFTNLVDGIVNLLIMNYTSLVIGKDFSFIKVCGDDNLIPSDDILNTDSLVRIVKTLFNMNIEFLEDGKFDKHIARMKFLGSYWSRDGPERDVTRMMLSASKQS
jgi:hypothetical protein